MAVANVAELLAERGLSVLMVDFDLEAPGLERFFDQQEDPTPETIQAARGVIDLLVSYKELRSLPFVEASQTEADEDGSFPFAVEPLRNFVTPISASSEGGQLLIVPAGRRNGSEYVAYAERVRSFDWDEFYARWDGEAFFEWFRQQAESLADVVLLDSRTGITELSGVCTFQLADVVVIFVAPNEQNLDGCELIAKSLQRRTLIEEGRGGRELRVLPIPSRVDNSESESLQRFSDDFERRFGPFIPGQLNFENTAFIDLKVPYVPAYAFRETVAVRQPDRAVATDLIAAYSRLTNALVELAPTTSRIYSDFHAPIESYEPDLSAPVAASFTGRTWLVDRVNAWLAESSEPLMFVTGEPGSGKTAFVRWLSGSTSADERPLGSRVVYAHFCSASDGRTLDPRIFVETLAKRLSALIPGYASRLLATRHSEINVEVRQSISATSSPTLFLGDVSVGRVSATVAFDELVRGPLEFAPTDGPMLVVIDGLDGAANVSQPESLADLVRYVGVSRPPNLRILITSRPHGRLLTSLRGPTVDLIADSPGLDDIRSFARLELNDLGPDRRDELAELVTAVSGGNFLVAELALEQVRRVGTEDPRELFQGATVQRLFEGGLSFDVGPELDLSDSARFLLAVLAVAQAGFRVGELAGIVRMSPAAVEEAIGATRQFLRFGRDGKVRLFHEAFAEFVREAPTTAPHIVDAHAAIVRFLLDEHEGPWIGSTDEYAVHFAVGHLLEALERAANRTQRQEILALVIQFAMDEAFLTTRVASVGLGALASDFRRIARLAASLVKLPHLADSLCEALDRIARSLDEASSPPEPERFVELFMERVVREIASAYGTAYERVRDAMPLSRERTSAMNGLLNEVRALADAIPDVPIDVASFLQGGPGDRVVGLAVLQVRPDPDMMHLVTRTIAGSESAFEQYHALHAATRLLPIIGREAREELADALDAERRDVRDLGIRSDASRWGLINDLLLQLSEPRS